MLVGVFQEYLPLRGKGSWERTAPAGMFGPHVCQGLFESALYPPDLPSPAVLVGEGGSAFSLVAQAGRASPS